MTYNFLSLHELQPHQIASAIAVFLKVPSDSVDVADADGDQDDRNWDAAALCDYSRVQGDVSLSLDIDVQEWVPDQPDEADAALAFAVSSRTAVLYPAEENLPSAYWLVTPAPIVTRARLNASDDEPPTYTVEAVEEPVRELPAAQVMQLPEILQAQKIPTPTADQFTAAIQKLRESQENATDPLLEDEPGTLLYEARVGLFLWERMVRRMESGWEPSGRYPLDMYRKDLQLRDELAQYTMTAPPKVRELLSNAVQQLDDVMAQHTVQDEHGVLIGRHPGESSQHSKLEWWWHRTPEPAPWTT
ncbi:hypothetical protein [Streptomyces decoyicus]|uniref:hypothetical protein n=1 Tax=Streptomyces decoyicus TaxID=249567 RepID=UPI00386669B6